MCTRGQVYQYFQLKKTPNVLEGKVYQYFQLKKPVYQGVCRKSLTNFITYCYVEYTSTERDLNSLH